MAKRTKQERIDAIKLRLDDLWMGVHGYYAAEKPNDDVFSGYAGAGAAMFGQFIGSVLTAFEIDDFGVHHIEHFDTPDTLALWIVEEQDRRARLAKETP
jgi:hypothetical protein